MLQRACGGVSARRRAGDKGQQHNGKTVVCEGGAGDKGQQPAVPHMCRTLGISLSGMTPTASAKTCGGKMTRFAMHICRGVHLGLMLRVLVIVISRGKVRHYALQDHARLRCGGDIGENLIGSDAVAAHASVYLKMRFVLRPGVAAQRRGPRLDALNRRQHWRDSSGSGGAGVAGMEGAHEKYRASRSAGAQSLRLAHGGDSNARHSASHQDAANFGCTVAVSVGFDHRANFDERTDTGSKNTAGG